MSERRPPPERARGRRTMQGSCSLAQYLFHTPLVLRWLVCLPLRAPVPDRCAGLCGAGEGWDAAAAPGALSHVARWCGCGAFRRPAAATFRAVVEANASGPNSRCAWERLAERSAPAPAAGSPALSQSAVLLHMPLLVLCLQGGAVPAETSNQQIEETTSTTSQAIARATGDNAEAAGADAAVQEACLYQCCACAQKRHSKGALLLA